MESIRQLTLINSLGERLSLNERKHFLTEISGLGFERVQIYAQSDGIFFQSQNELKQPIINGKIVFECPSPYEEYNKFVNWISNGPVKLEYTSFETYLMDIDSTYLNKSEKLSFGILVCPISLTGTTPFYKVNQSSVTCEVETGVKKYTYTYPTKYPSGEGMSYLYSPKGHFDSAMEVTIFGVATDPSITIFKGSEIIGRCLMTGVVLGMGDRIFYSSRPGKFYVKKNDTNVIEYCLPTDNNFARLPKNGEYRIEIGGAAAATITFYDYFQGV